MAPLFFPPPSSTYGTGYLGRKFAKGQNIQRNTGLSIERSLEAAECLAISDIPLDIHER
jgi:hypothetical protein